MARRPAGRRCSARCGGAAQNWLWRRELFATPLARAAAAMDAIVGQNHPFVDGNKRTGLLAAAFALEREGFELRPDPAELVEVTVGLATHAVSLEKLTSWLQERSQPVGGA